MAALAMVALVQVPGGPSARFAELDRQTAGAISHGDYSAAAALAGEALALSRELRDRKREAQAFGRLASARLYDGRYQQARDLYRQALQIDRELGDSQGQVLHLNNLGSLAYFQGAYQEALEHYRAAERVLSRTPEHEWTARLRSATAVNVATLYQRLGLGERALEAYRQVEPAVGAMKAREQAQRLSNLGALYRHLGDPYKALESYERAMQLYARDRDPDGELGALKNTGIALALDLRDYRAALRTFDKVLVRAGETHNRREAMQARLYRAETLRRMGRPARAGFEAVLAAARELKTPEEEWKALFALGRVEEAALVIESLRGQAPGGALRGQFLAGKRDVYDAAIEQSLRRNSQEEFLRWAGRARARLLQDQLGKAPARGAGLEELRRALRPGALLLVYWMGPRRGGLLWATRERAGLLAREPGDVREILKRLAAPDGADWRRYASAMGARLLGGIPPLEAGAVREVIVVPDGLLQVIPFETLPVPGRTTLLVDEAAVSYLPAASMLLREHGKRGWWNPPWRRSLVALAAGEAADPLAAGEAADPLAAGEAADPLAGGAPLPPLPYAVREAEAIAGRLPGRTLVLEGDAAARGAWEAAAAAGVPILHAAAHAAISEETPERSRILLAREALFLGEVARLSLERVDLVTLSACETEQGRLVEGEGIPSFSRAFLAAGARAAVTTLWRVPDRPSAAFMETFYYHLARGRSKAAALAEAKRRFLRSGTSLAHPYYWAAFVLNGEGWEPVPLPVRWAPVLALCGLAILAVMYWRRRTTG